MRDKATVLRAKKTDVFISQKPEPQRYLWQKAAEEAFSRYKLFVGCKLDFVISIYGISILKKRS